MKDIITQIYEDSIKNEKGEVASYIPQLANVNPELFGIALCDLNGTIDEWGDSSVEFSIQSCSKPLNYLLARKLNPQINIHQHVGYEPSGKAFNEFILNKDNLPHNPMINAGAIMVNSFIGPEMEPSERFDLVRHFYNSLGGAIGDIGFNNSMYLSEQNHADRNISLAYEMRSKKVFHTHPSHSKIQETLNLYFQSCSININCKIGALIAATLANGGINPMSRETVVERTIVKDCLSLMYSCGMYDYSGQFSFEIGLPAKSGVSGCLLLVIPKHYGICIWSPRLDMMGNSVRGVQFCKQLSQLTHNRYHIFNIIETSIKDKTDSEIDAINLTQKIIHLSSKGNLEELKSIASNTELSIFNSSDYDGRTALHLACSEGQFEVVKYLIEELKCDIYPKDRWGNTPLHDAKKKMTDNDTIDESNDYQNIISFIHN